MGPVNPFGGKTNGQTAPAQPAQDEEFSFELPADAGWELFEAADLLPFDGYYAAEVVGESPRKGDNPGVFVTFRIHDEDAAGKKISMFLGDPTQKNTAFLWRGLIASIWGVEHGKGAISYKKGQFIGGTAFFKTERYLNNRGEPATGVKSFITEENWKAAVADGKHRWPPTLKEDAGGAPGFGAQKTPTGVPAGFGVPQPQQGAPIGAQQEQEPPKAGVASGMAVSTSTTRTEAPPKPAGAAPRGFPKFGNK